MQTLSTALVGLLALSLAGATLYLAAQAQAHATLGSGSQLLVPTLVTIGLIIVCCAAMGLGAWALWQREHKMASQLLGVLTALTPIMLWTSADAANVVLDGSEPTAHDTTLVERRRNKDKDFLVLESWAEDGEEIMLDVNQVTGGHTLQPGDPARVVVHEGAFGRPYAVSVEPR